MSSITRATEIRELQTAFAKAQVASAESPKTDVWVFDEVVAQTMIWVEA